MKVLASYLTLGTALYSNEVRERLNVELTFMKSEGLIISLEEEEKPPWTFFILCDSQGKKNGEKRIACRFAVAKAIADLFVNHTEFLFVKKYINKCYKHWFPHEREEITARAAEVLEKLRVIRRNKILQNLYDYLAGHQVLIVEGYANFQLREYWNQLRKMVHRVGQELVATKDYLEFIRLLRHFIEIQEPKIQEVHVLINPAGTCYLFDHKGNIIRKELLRAPSLTVSKGEFSYEDVLLSILITLAPQRIAFHVPDRIWYGESVQVILQVFENRVVRCGGCDKCQLLSAGYLPTKIKTD
ncbi:MAG: putative sporulation protein YtxC [Bacillota bacterium]|nr:putative sporulation protein YtxC [Bacillota bacterium]